VRERCCFWLKSSMGWGIVFECVFECVSENAPLGDGACERALLLVEELLHIRLHALLEALAALRHQGSVGECDIGHARIEGSQLNGFFCGLLWSVG
jgi:hypothetical protein